MRKIVVKLMYVLWALNESLKPCIGYKVYYKGKLYYVKSSLNGYGKWNLICPITKDVHHFNINQKKLKVMPPSFKTWRSVFYGCYYFQKSSWYSIDIKKSIFKRISYKTSEDISF